MADAVEVRQLLGSAQSVVTIAPDATVAEAAALMAAHRIGSLLVTRDGSTIVGILSERDVLTKIVAVGRDPAQTRVAQIMTGEIISCHRGTTLSGAQQMMAEHDIRHLPIIEDDQAIGMISSRDILRHQLASVQDIARSQVHMLQRLERMFPGITDD